jgi:NAD(P)-dependent dehydrogenase (short-subunit alcohol dehydrogenase family)
MSEQLRLYALKAVVTGAADGIGEAIARTLVKHGAEVVAVDTPESGVESVFGKLRGISTCAIDLQAQATPETLANAVRDRLNGLDILVNNFFSVAQSASDGEAGRKQELEAWLDRIDSNARALLPLLRKSPAGRIINIGSLRSSFGRDGEADFAASQQALAERTAAQAAEYGAFGITANYLQPGAIMTPDSREIFEADKSFRDYCIARSAAKRLGEPVDVAKVALFLASDDSVFVSGTGIIADGGRADPT